jgi:hypothetical protein
MNAYINDKPTSANLEPELVLDWRVDIDRISRRAREAFQTGTPDPWTRIEAECVIQLIDAELIAMANRQCRGELVDASIHHLKALRTETVSAIKTLDAVEWHSKPVITGTDEAPSAGSAAQANGEDFSVPPDASTAPFLSVENPVAAGRSLHRQ